MNNNDIELILLSKFPITKLKKDTWSCIEEEKDEEGIITTYNSDDYDEFRSIKIKDEEELSLIGINVIFNKYKGLSYSVVIAIGDFIPPDDTGISKIEKGCIRLKYNDDLTNYDYEFFYDLMNSENLN